MLTPCAWLVLGESLLEVGGWGPLLQHQTMPAVSMVAASESTSLAACSCMHAACAILCRGPPSAHRALLHRQNTRADQGVAVGVLAGSHAHWAIVVGCMLPCNVVHGPGCGPMSRGHCMPDRNLLRPMRWLPTGLLGYLELSSWCGDVPTMCMPCTVEM